MEFIDKCAVVTGGGMGIGNAIAFKLADEGADIAIFDVDYEAAENAKKEIEKRGRKCLVVEVDVSNLISIRKAFEKVMNTLGSVDILVNNAGITHPTVDLTELDPDLWNKVIDVDFKGVYNCTRVAGEIMIKKGSGVVVNISSAGGQVSCPLVAYGPAKAAVNHFTQIVARGWASKGVRVNAIAPGLVLTPLMDKMIKDGLRDPETMLKRVPFHEFIMPEDIAEGVVFLCSKKAKFITGVTLPIDAGLIADAGWAFMGQ
jgi:3-oxoacyl-[acyl-carrier protein] reductase